MFKHIQRVVSASLLWKKQFPIISLPSSFLQPFPQSKSHDHRTDVRCDELHIAIIIPERRNFSLGRLCSKRVNEQWKLLF